MKIAKMNDVFLISALFTVAPPSNYDCTQKHWSRCQKLAEHLSFHRKYCDLHLKEISEKKNFISPKNLLPGYRVYEG